MLKKAFGHTIISDNDVVQLGLIWEGGDVW